MNTKILPNKYLFDSLSGQRKRINYHPHTFFKLTHFIKCISHHQLVLLNPSLFNSTKIIYSKLIYLKKKAREERILIKKNYHEPPPSPIQRIRTNINNSKTDT